MLNICSNMSKKVEKFGVYRSLYSTFFISKVFGLCPFAIKTKEKYTLDKRSTGVSLCVILVYAGFAIYQSKRLNVDFETSVSFRLIEFLSSIVRLLTVFFAPTWEIVQQKNLLQLLEDISGFDREAHVTGQSEENPTYRSDRLFSVSTVVVVTILQVCLVAVTIVGRGIMGDIHTYLDLAETLTYYAPEYVTSAITLQISALATLLGRRFAIINSELEKLLESWNNPKVYARRTRTSGSKRTYSCLSKTELQEQLHSLRTKHYHLHAMSKSLNQRYTFQLSFVILRIFLDLVKNLLFFFVDRGFSSGVWISQSACLTLTIAMVQLLLIAFSCSSSDSKLKATGPILHEIKNTDEHIDEDVRFFSVQILQYDFKITAMNVVTMNRPLITRVLAAVFSYVFLVMQLNLA